MAKWCQWPSDICLACNSASKTTEHVLFYRNPDRTQCWHRQVPQLVQWLQRTDTHPEIIQVFKHALHARGSTFASQATPLTQLVASMQADIGLFGFFLGHLSSYWLTIQQHYYATIGSSRVATTWAKCLCQQLLQFTYTLWISCNQQIKSIWQNQELQQLDQAILEQFQLGMQNLATSNHFYVIQSPPGQGQGFDLPSVLAMDITDKRLWLSAISDARARVQNVTTQSLP